MGLNTDANRLFNKELRSFLDKVKGDLSAYVRLISLDLFTRFVVKTPVDTGRAKGGWQMLLGTAPTEETGVLDPTGQLTIASAMAAASAITPDNVLQLRVFISNPVFYIVYLDQGHSHQTPANFTDLALHETQAKYFTVI